MSTETEPSAGPTIGSSGTGSSSAGPGPTIGGDWAGQITGKVEDVVSIIRDRTVRPVEQAVRYVVFGLLAIVVGLLVVTLVAILALRVLTNEVPVFTHRVWASYLVLAGIFWALGLLLLKLRRPRTK
jgi:hypothetical protein